MPETYDPLAPEVEALRGVPFFEDLTPEDLQRLARIGEKRHYEPGDEVVRKDEEGVALYVILSGSARVTAGGTTHTLGPGDFFGEMALLEGTRRTATVTAAEPVEAMVIEATYFRPFLIKNASVTVTILEGVTRRLREVQDRIDRAGEGS
ncbi:MAG TPA: cyclic nucleotide-binding domain-containing protein [Actinomycetota bacterium]|jgi:CPA2 family monovalent cation:H+ antiporter-2|nr:cyclic nucleotide-binding domain-containing protein [Actinomycetota bacterium]